MVSRSFIFHKFSQEDVLIAINNNFVLLILCFNQDTLFLMDNFVGTLPEARS